MNGNYQVSRFYAQERVEAQLTAAANHRQARKARAGAGSRAAAVAARAYVLVSRVANQVASKAAHSLEAFGRVRVAYFHR